MAERSAGLLVYRRVEGSVQFLLAHPGGPFWRGRDAGAWTIPKGLIEDGEDILAAARREFEEETGQPVDGRFRPLQPQKQKSGKVVHAFLVEADIDLDTFRSNLFDLEWPRRSGHIQAFPEIDRIGWFGPDEALAKVLPGQAAFVREALAAIK